MNSIQWPGNAHWPIWQRILFRFLFVYFVLMIAPWGLIDFIPGANSITQYYYDAVDWLVTNANTHLFKQYKVLVQPNGSGDTSWAYTQMWLYLLLAFIACIIWSVLAQKNISHNRLAYWFRIILRYFLIMNCFGYGFAKVFLQQMPFPSLSQLATPLGDFLPMRLSWLFLGYSSTYQFFSGLMEVLAGLFLLYRRTSTFGTLFAAGVFINVFVMNIAYDIPVKLFSLHLLIYALVLLAFEYQRILHFFFLNKPVSTSNLYDVSFPKRWMKITRIVLKLAIVFVTIVMPLYEGLLPEKEKASSFPIKSGIYTVETFVKNGDTIPYSITDSLRWNDMIFETNGSGSIKTTDTTFRQLYKRGYFMAKADSNKQTIKFSKRDWMFNTYDLFTLRYNTIDSNTVTLNGRMRKDSIHVRMKRTNRHFQLAERQFHWLSEYNR